MGTMIRFCLRNSLLVNLITILFLVSGTYAVFKLQRELFPNVNFDVITVRVNIPGAAPEDVEKLVTIKLERELAGVEGIEELNALSGEGFSLFDLKVAPSSNITEVLNEVRNRVEVVELPEDAEAPVVQKVNSKQRAILKIAVVHQSEQKRREIAKVLRQRIERNPGVAQVQLKGMKQRELNVGVDLDKIRRYNVTLSEIVSAIRDREVNVSAGNVKNSSGETLVRTLNEIKTPEDIENIVIRSNFSGEMVRIGDVASARMGLEEDADFDRVDAEIAIFVDIIGKGSGDIIDITDEAKAIAQDLKKESIADGVKFSYVDELAFYIKRRLGIVFDNGVQGLILVVLCLLLFLNWRISLITTFGAPLSFCVAFTIMLGLGMTLNLVSMMGILLVLGMLVDDAIIVAEQFYQNRERGLALEQAAYEAAMKTLGPVTLTIMTTMMAFGVMFFLGGIWGKFLWPVPAVVCICLIASWLECFFILPGHLVDFSGKKKITRRRRWYFRFRKRYVGLLALCLRRPALTIVFFGGLFVGSLVLFQKQMRFELFPPDDVRIVVLNIKGPVGTSLEKTAAVVAKYEKIVQEIKLEGELENFRSLIGKQQMLNARSFQRSGPHYATLSLYFESAHLRPRPLDEFLDELLPRMRQLNSSYDIDVNKIKGGPPQGRPIDIEVRGESLDTVKLAAKQLVTEVQKKDGVTSANLDFEEGKNQVVMQIDEAQARRLGLTNAAIARELRSLYQGIEVLEIAEGRDDIVVRVQAAQKDRRELLASLEKIQILNSSGRRIPLLRVATPVERPGAFVIRRTDQTRVISVQGALDSEKATASSLANELDVFFKRLKKKFPEISIEFGGEKKDTDESLADFRFLGSLTFAAIFLLLVGVFANLISPIVIVSAIPFGLTGVILTFFFLQKAIGFMALMGVIGLIGVVVNDSIVLVSFIQSEVQEGKALIGSVMRSAHSRFRPVLLTTFTTVAGLLPIAHSAGGDPFLKPMALSFAYGLLFSTSLTLLFVPVLYYSLFKLKIFLKARQ